MGKIVPGPVPLRDRAVDSAFLRHQRVLALLPADNAGPEFLGVLHHKTGAVRRKTDNAVRPVNAEHPEGFLQEIQDFTVPSSSLSPDVFSGVIISL